MRKKTKAHIDKPFKEKLLKGSSESGKLTKDGLVYRNDLLTADLTSQTGVSNRSRKK